MNTIQLKVAGAGLFFLFIFLSGFWLSHLGKPYNMVVFNIHKLIAVAAAVFLGVTIYQVHQAAALSPAEWAAVAAMALLFIGTVVTGGLVSIETPMPPFVLTIHHVTPYLTVLATALTCYLLVIRQPVPG